MEPLQRKMKVASLILHRAVEEKKAAENAAAVAECDCEQSLEARRCIQAVAQSIQETVHRRVAGVVSRCLSVVFDEPYEFRVKFVQKRGKTEAELVFCRNGREIDPMTASGGGVVDVAAFALRLACLMLSRPSPRRMIVLDEPFKFVSEEYRDRVKEMLLELADQMKIQFVMVTHIRELECGKVMRIGKVDGSVC